MYKFNRWLFIILFSLSLIFTCCKNNSDINEPATPQNPLDVKNLRIESQDKSIQLTWVIPEAANIDKIMIEYDNAEKTTVELEANASLYTFTAGIHGQYYSFNVYTLNKQGQKSNGITKKALFTDFSEFDNTIMLINIPDNIEITTKEWLSKQVTDLADCTLIEKNSENKSLKIDIKGRGNSSWWVPKHSYSIKLDKKENLFGIANGKHKNYALIANYFDKTLIRNKLAYYVGEQIFDSLSWSQHTKSVNVFINGTYRGVYLLTERIKIDENEINVPDVSKTDKLTDVNNDGVINCLDGGWILEINERLDETYNWITDNSVSISLKDPDDYEGWENIRDYINDVESVLYNDSIFTDVDNGWRKYLDESSFIDWLIINEIAKNPDSCWYSSCYMYFNPSDQKLYMGPVWDFDIGFGNVNYNESSEYEGFWAKESGWYVRLFEDSVFVNNVKARWTQKKSEIDSLFDIIEQYTQAVENDARLNFTVYPILGTYVWANPDGYEDRTTYQSEVDFLTAWLSNRIPWLDQAIGELGV